MKIALVQMAMSEDPKANLDRALEKMAEAAKGGADLVFFPEVMLSPFFPQHEKKDASRYLMKIDDPAVKKLQKASKDLGILSVPNIYLEKDGKKYDASIVIDRNGSILGVSKMVHIVRAPQFYEKDYYYPSETGFPVYQTDVGRIGVVVCFDRHFPESIRTCAMKGADLIIIPTANTVGESLDLFEWELRVAAYQNGVFVTTCNRVGQEDEMEFCGESLIATPEGGLLTKAGKNEQILFGKIDFSEIKKARQKRPFLDLIRSEAYFD